MQIVRIQRRPRAHNLLLLATSPRPWHEFALSPLPSAPAEVLVPSEGFPGGYFRVPLPRKDNDVSKCHQDECPAHDHEDRREHVVLSTEPALSRQNQVLLSPLLVGIEAVEHTERQHRVLWQLLAYDTPELPGPWTRRHPHPHQEMLILVDWHGEVSTASISRDGIEVHGVVFREQIVDVGGPCDVVFVDGERHAIGGLVQAERVVEEGPRCQATWIDESVIGQGLVLLSTQELLRAANARTGPIGVFTMQLVVIHGSDISSVVLVERIDLVEDVDRRIHFFFHGEVEFARHTLSMVGPEQLLRLVTIQTTEVAAVVVSYFLHVHVEVRHQAHHAERHPRRTEGQEEEEDGFRLHDGTPRLQFLLHESLGVLLVSRPSQPMGPRARRFRRRLFLSRPSVHVLHGARVFRNEAFLHVSPRRFRRRRLVRLDATRSDDVFGRVSTLFPSKGKPFG
eukprot:scaffold1909_cov303-Pavlova_lutheri.AAC.7